MATDILSTILAALPEQERNGYFEGMEVETEHTWDKDNERWVFPTLANKRCYLVQEQFPFTDLYTLSDTRFEELVSKRVPFFYDPRFGVRFFEGVQGAAFATVNGMQSGVVPTATKDELTTGFLDQASDIYGRDGRPLEIRFAALRTGAHGPCGGLCPKLVFSERDKFGRVIWRHPVEVRRNSANNSGLLYYNAWDVLEAERVMANALARQLASNGSRGSRILAEVFFNQCGAFYPDVIEVMRTCQLRRCDFLTLAEIKLISTRVCGLANNLAVFAEKLEVSYVAF